MTDFIYFVFQSKLKGTKNHSATIPGIFAIALKGKQAAPSHLCIYTKLRSWDEAFLLLIQADAVQVQVTALASTPTANKALSTVFPNFFVYLIWLNSTDRALGTSVCFSRTSDIAYCSSLSQATQEGSILFLSARGPGWPYGVLLTSLVSNAIATTLRRSIRTWEYAVCWSFHSYFRSTNRE